MVDAFVARCKDAGITKVVGIESRGSSFGASLAYALGAGLTIARKPGKLLGNDPRGLRAGVRRGRARAAYRRGETWASASSSWTTCSRRVVRRDAVGRLVARQGAKLAAYSFLVELGFLGGAKRLGREHVHALLSY